jgi:hypothetical protein
MNATEVKTEAVEKTDAERENEFFNAPRFVITVHYGGGRVANDILSWAQLFAGHQSGQIAPSTPVDLGQGKSSRTADQLIHSYQHFLAKEKKSWHEKPKAPANREPATIKTLEGLLQKLKGVDGKIAKINAALTEAESEFQRYELGAGEIDVLGLTDVGASARHTAMHRHALIRELGPKQIHKLHADRVELLLELRAEIIAFSPIFRNYLEGLQARVVEEFRQAHGAEFSEENATEAAMLTLKFIELEEILHSARIDSMDANNQEEIAQRFMSAWRAGEAFEKKSNR